ncbi:cation transporter [Coralloluteibacterium thermophilus]|uniref:Cation transporter n=1 Tax=Coralloluteibacterium thermophilum TaxID=2707049 RepID=A0ABV9NJQ0_9GAMM
MRPIARFEAPPHVTAAARRAWRLQVAMIVYGITVIVGMGLAAGESQAMRTAWIEDMLMLVPPIAYLFADRLRRRQPDRIFPFGRFGAVDAAYLVSAFALVAVGGLLLWEGASTLVRGERPSIGSVFVGGHQVWQGWFMWAALLWAVVPAVWLGHLLNGPAKTLHDRSLHGSAEMLKADWQTGVAAAVGVLGIGLGIWWMDAVAALVVASSVVLDGLRNTARAFGALMEHRPMLIGRPDRPDDLVERFETALRALPEVADAEVRLRESGWLLLGEVVLHTREATSPEQDEALYRAVAETAAGLSWRVHDPAVSIRVARSHGP